MHVIFRSMIYFKICCYFLDPKVDRILRSWTKSSRFGEVLALKGDPGLFVVSRLYVGELRVLDPQKECTNVPYSGCTLW